MRGRLLLGRVVSQADGKLLCWVNRSWLMLLVAAVVVLVTALRPQRVLATNRQSNGKMKFPVMSIPWQEDGGSNLSASKGFFSREISVKVYLYDQLVMEFLNSTRVSCPMFY